MKNELEKLEQKYGKEFDKKEKKINTEIDPKKREDLERMIEIIAGKLREKHVEAIEIEKFSAELLQMAIEVERMHNALRNPEPIYQNVFAIDGMEFLKKILDSNVLNGNGTPNIFQRRKKEPSEKVILEKLKLAVKQEMSLAFLNFERKLKNRN